MKIAAFNSVDTGNEYFGRLLELDSECRGIQFWLNLYENFILQCRRTWINTTTQWDSNSILTYQSPKKKMADKLAEETT